MISAPFERIKYVAMIFGVPVEACPTMEADRIVVFVECPPNARAVSIQTDKIETIKRFMSDNKSATVLTIVVDRSEEFKEGGIVSAAGFGFFYSPRGWKPRDVKCSPLGICCSAFGPIR